MGMYTEIIFGASLKKDTPSTVIDTIHRLIAGDEFNPDVSLDVPDHPFFSTERRWLLISGGSAYFPGTVEPKFWYDYSYEQWFLHFRTNIKNYDGAIEKFLDWILPYIDDGVGHRNFYAIVTYEEADEPTIYYLSSLSGRT